MMELIFIELPKFKEPEKLPKNVLDRWITFLKTGSDSMLEELKMGGENFFKAVSEVELAAMNPEERNIYYSRLDGLRDYLSDVSASRIEGKAEGKAEGLAEGFLQAIRSYCSLRFPGLELNQLANFGILSEGQLKELLQRIYSAGSTQELETIFQEFQRRA